MNDNCPDFDYESFLEQLSHQDELLKNLEEEKINLDVLYRETLSKHETVLNALNEKKAINDTLKANMKAKLLIQEYLNNKLEDMQGRFYLVHQNTLGFPVDECQLVFFTDMNELYTQYKNFDSEFDDDTLRKKIEDYDQNISLLKEEEEQYECILMRARENSIFSHANRDPHGTHPLKPLSGSVSEETVQEFGSLDYLTLKLANAQRNINALQKNIVEFNQELESLSKTL